MLVCPTFVDEYDQQYRIICSTDVCVVHCPIKAGTEGHCLPDLAKLVPLISGALRVDVWPNTIQLLSCVGATQIMRAHECDRVQLLYFGFAEWHPQCLSCHCALAGCFGLVDTEESMSASVRTFNLPMSAVECEQWRILFLGPSLAGWLAGWLFVGSQALPGHCTWLVQFCKIVVCMLRCVRCLITISNLVPLLRNAQVQVQLYSCTVLYSHCTLLLN